MWLAAWGGPPRRARRCSWPSPSEVLVPALRNRPDAILVPPRACCARSLRRSDEAPPGTSWQPAGAQSCRRPRCPRPQRACPSPPAALLAGFEPIGATRLIQFRRNRRLAQGGGGEQAWSKLKASLRATGARPRQALKAALGPALRTITAQDAQGWFRLARYRAPVNQECVARSKASRADAVAPMSGRSWTTSFGV